MVKAGAIDTADTPVDLAAELPLDDESVPVAALPFRPWARVRTFWSSARADSPKG
jgi:hypothetical protein